MNSKTVVGINGRPIAAASPAKEPQDAVLVGCCSTCAFSDKHPQAIGELICRRNPPTAVAAMSAQGMAIISAVPPVRKNDWCGEYDMNEETAALEAAKVQGAANEAPAA